MGRIVNRELIMAIHSSSCELCNSDLNCWAYYIKPKEQGGHDLEENLFCFCEKHGQEFEILGLTKFTKKYQVVLFLLSSRGWIKRGGKYIHPIH